MIGDGCNDSLRSAGFKVWKDENNGFFFVNSCQTKIF